MQMAWDTFLICHQFAGKFFAQKKHLDYTQDVAWQWKEYRRGGGYEYSGVLSSFYR